MSATLAYTGEIRDTSGFQKAISHGRYMPQGVISLPEIRAWRKIESELILGEKYNIAGKIAKALENKKRRDEPEVGNNIIRPDFSQKQGIGIPNHNQVILFPTRKTA